MVYFAKWKMVLVLAICALGLAFAVPTFLSRDQANALPAWLPNQQISLGLDLQGGSHLLLEVDSKVVIREYLESLVDTMRIELRKARIRYQGLGVEGNAAKVTIKDPAKTEQARQLLRALDADTETTTDGNRIFLTLTEKTIRDRKVAAVQQSIEIVRRRVDETGTREPTIQRQGDDRILVQVPGLQDPERLKAILGKTAKMVFRLVDLTTSPAEIMAGARTPPGSELLESDERNADGSPVDMYVVRKRVMVSGDTLVDSSATFQDNMPVVSFRFDSVGAKRFGEATKKNVRKPFAIVLDRRVISAPVIREPILGGTGIISGNFTVQEVQDLSLLLRAGALPAPLKILEERTVGPALGADSVAAGKIACVIAFIAVMVFMVLSYGLFGLAADIALVFNLFLIMGALSILQATLTLPGIAGIVLTIGMAVDANVLVFERIREEIRTGKTPFAAMEAGYQRAIGTILDANITTLIAAVILFAMGSGPIKGFAVTLGIGIITSVFTAVVVTRLMLVIWLRRTRPAALPI